MKRIFLPLRFGLAAILGNGKQYFSWIHIDDLCDIYIKAIEDTGMIGAYNAAAPEHLTYLSLIKRIRAHFGKPSILIKVPRLFLKLIFGEMSNIILEGSRVSSQKLIESGYEFTFPSLGIALSNLIKKNK